MKELMKIEYNLREERYKALENHNELFREMKNCEIDEDFNRGCEIENEMNALKRYINDLTEKIDTLCKAQEILKGEK